MPLRSRTAGAKSRGTIGLLGGFLGLTTLACTTPTVAARAVWIAGEHAVDGSRTFFMYAAGEITTSTLRPLDVDSDTDARRLLVELGPRGEGALIRGVDDGWTEQLGAASGFRAGYLDLAHLRSVPLALPPELVPANTAAFTAAGDALVWGESCPPGIAVVPLIAEVATEIDVETGGARPLRAGGKPARAQCNSAGAPAAASAADAPVVFRVEAVVSGGRSVARVGAEIEALRYPARVGDELSLTRLAIGSLPAGHRPIALTSAACAGGDPGCGLAVVDPDGAAVSFAVTEGDCRLMRWAVDEAKAVCAIAANDDERLQADGVVAAISSEHYVLRDGPALVRYAWATGEVLSRPLVGEGDDASVQTTADGRAVVMTRPRGPMLRVDVDGMELVNVEQRECAGPQTPVLSPSGRIAAWTCTTRYDPSFAVDGGQDALQTGDVVRVSAGGMQRFQGVPMWALAVDDEGNVLMHSQRVNQQLSDVELGETAGGARNLYVLAADGELARISNLEPDPERIFGLSRETRRITARPM